MTWAISNITAESHLNRLENAGLNTFVWLVQSCEGRLREDKLMFKTRLNSLICAGGLILASCFFAKLLTQRSRFS